MDFNNMKDFGFEDLNVRKSVFDMQVITCLLYTSV